MPSYSHLLIHPFQHINFDTFQSALKENSTLFGIFKCMWLLFRADEPLKNMVQKQLCKLYCINGISLLLFVSSPIEATSQVE